jgi:hypothetical protein
MSTPTKLLRAGPLARRLRVPVKWLRDEAEAGRLPHLKCGKTVLFDPDAVEQVMVARARQEVPRAS